MVYHILKGIYQEAVTSLVLVTGASGFLGRHVVQALVDRGHRVRAVLHRRGRERLFPQEAVEVAYADVFDPDSCRQVMYDVDAVIHLVAIIKERGKRATFENINYLGTANVVTVARGAGVKRFVHMSVVGAQSNPEYPYLNSKWLGEQAVVTSGISYTVMRGSLLFGPGDEFINTLAGIVKAFPLVPMAGSGKARFQPIHVDDAARCLADAVEGREELRNRTIEIGGPGIVTYKEMLSTIAQTLRVKRLPAPVPLPLIRIPVWFMDCLLPNPPVTGQQLNMLAINNLMSDPPVQKSFGFTPRPLEGNIEYVKDISYGDALRIALGFMPKHIRDH